MTSIALPGNFVVNRPRLCRSDHQPNLLEYIDTTLNESFSLNVTLMRNVTNRLDQFGNTILDQYFIYLLCQKINPNRSDHLTDNFYRLFHEFLMLNETFSKAVFEYVPSVTHRTIFNSYTNFIWNEFDVNVLLELACFLLKYRLSDLFSGRDEKILGFFLEITAIYYLSSNHLEFFRNSRSIDMIFPSPSLYLLSSQSSHADEQISFKKFLHALHENGEIHFDIRQIKQLLQTEAHQFLNQKLENKKLGFIQFLERNLLAQQQNSCRSLKSICRMMIKNNLKHYPSDIQQLNLIPMINEQLQQFLTYENQFAFESYV